MAKKSGYVWGYAPDRRIGGEKRLYEVLDTVKELGGVKKFKELAAAIAGTETDAVPF